MNEKLKKELNISVFIEKWISERVLLLASLSHTREVYSKNRQIW